MIWRDHPILKPPTAEEMAVMEPEDLQRLHKLYHEAIGNSERDPYRYGFVLPNWVVVEELLENADAVLALGGNRCLAGEQEIYDPVAKMLRRVDSIDAPFHVYAWDETTKQQVVARAEVPFRKPSQPLFRVGLSNGQTLSCSGEHLVLTPSGWQAVGRLSVGSCISQPTQGCSEESERPAYSPVREPSTSDIAREASLQGAAHWTKTPPDSQSDCPPCSRSGGEQPQRQAEGGQGVAPSQGDVLQHTSPSGSIYRQPSTDAARLSECIRDVQGNTRSDSLAQLSLRLSILGALPRSVALSVGTQSRSSCTPYKSALQLSWDRAYELDRRQSSAGFHPEQSGRQSHQLDKQSHYALASSDNSTAVSTVLTVDYLRDDTVWDFEVPVYHTYVAAGIINHNSGKTQCGAYLTVKCAMENDGALIVCFAQNAELSVLVQQAAIFHHLPVEYKQKTLGQEEYISYTKQNGFAGNSIIFPNGSRILFKTYSQFQQNQTVLEGLELGAFEAKAVNIGAWCDEYLGGPELINTLSFRLATRNAKMLLTFTPIDGYSETVRIYLEGAKTERTKTAELLNNRQVPYVQRCKDRDAAIVYLHTKDNPFSGYERVAKEAIAKGDESWILCRLYGIPTKSISSKFPSFSRETNVIPHDKLPWLSGGKAEDFTHYMVLDPAGRKKWFMVWIAVDASETWWVYREWPDVGIGDWAEWKNGKWAPGEGAKRDGQVEGVNQYAELIRQIEKDEGVTVFERLIDPRLGAAKYQSMTGSSSIIEDLADAGLSFVPAPGIEIDDGLQALHNKMAYDRKRPIDGNNRPRFYVSDRCENFIRAIQEYTGDDGKDEAWKDPLDCGRYAAVAEIRYIHPKWLNAGGGARGAY